VARSANARSASATASVRPGLIGPGGLIDDGGHAAHAYGQDTLILVRPDGYIGLIADAGHAPAVADYLRSLYSTRPVIYLLIRHRSTSSSKSLETLNMSPPFLGGRRK
jgi:hypothetical protein